MFYLNEENNWVEIQSFEKQNNKFYINGAKAGGETCIKDFCTTCKKEYIVKKIYYFTPGKCGVCKRKKTSLEKYGVDNPAKSKEIKIKIGRFNSENNKKLEVREKYKKTMKERYGVESNFQLQSHRDFLKTFLYSENINKKRSESNKFENKTEEERAAILEKRMETFRRNYGTDWSFQNEEVNLKKVETNKKHFGTEYPSQNNEIRKKQEETKTQKYGNKNNYPKMRKTFIKGYYENLSRFGTAPLFEERDYVGVLEKYKWRCNACGEEFFSDLKNGKEPRCPNCFPKFSGHSTPEKELVSWIASFGITMEENNRTIISPKELDIYLPDYSLAIEFDGLFWHSDKFQNKHYHLEKTQACEKQGIKLIHIFEDEWMYKQDIVKARLKNVLGLNSNRIGARKTTIREIEPRTKNKFLEKYHIQGKDNCRIKLGAFYEDELIGVMTFSKPRLFMNKKIDGDVWELSRFATISDTYTPGLASKMLTHFKNNYNWQEIYSYADRRWSQGGLYESIGFEFEYDTKPNYWYFNTDRIRFHRYNFRKQNLKEWSNYSLDKTEKQIMDEVGWFRIHDCGSKKYSLKNNAD